MLAIYRRHTRQCPFTSVREWRCGCPIWVSGTLGAATIRRSLNLVSRGAAQKIIDRWENQGFIDNDLSTSCSSREEPAQPSLRNPSELTRVDEAIQEYLLDMEDRHLEESTIRTYRPLFDELRLFCERAGIQYLCQINLDQARKIRRSWNTAANTSAKRLERLRAFLRFCQDNQWIDDNPAAKLKSPKTDTPPTLPFTQDEMAAILAGCDSFWGSNKKPGGQNAKRLKAFVLLMRYSGLRISDAIQLNDERIQGNRIFLYTQKTSVHVYVPMPPVFFEVLHQVEKYQSGYYFWSKKGKLRSRCANLQLTLKTLFANVGIQHDHAHRFRDTFAVELLKKGVPIEEVSVLLGHQSEKITRKHYSPWVKDRQDILEQHVMKGWDLPDEKRVIAFLKTS
jgi:integrase/recombinase XerD